MVKRSDLVKDFAGLLATEEGQRITREQEARNEFIRSVMEDMLDKHQGLPRPTG